MLDFRCKSCGKLLGKIDGKAEIKCPRCGVINRTREPPPQPKNKIEQIERP